MKNALQVENYQIRERSTLNWGHIAGFVGAERISVGNGHFHHCSYEMHSFFLLVKFWVKVSRNFYPYLSGLGTVLEPMPGGKGTRPIVGTAANSPWIDGGLKTSVRT